MRVCEGKYQVYKINKSTKEALNTIKTLKMYTVLGAGNSLFFPSCFPGRWTSHVDSHMEPSLSPSEALLLFLCAPVVLYECLTLQLLVYMSARSFVLAGRAGIRLSHL